MTPGLANPLSLFDVKGKVAIVTGASGAFGALAAEVLAAAGARLVLAAGKARELEDIAVNCRKLGAEVEPVNKRPSSEAECEGIVEAAKRRFGRVDILVVASGKNDVSKIVEMAPERFLDVMDANVTQSWLMARAVSRQMLGPTGITVNAIAPTVFRSPLTAWMFADDEKAKAVRAGFLARVPKGRLGEPEDLAGPLLFLASRASDFYTGHTLYADGGYTAG